MESFLQRLSGEAMVVENKNNKPTAEDRRLMQAAQEMLLHHRGQVKLETRTVHVPEENDSETIEKLK